MTTKIDPNQLKNPDLFVSTSDKIFNYIERHFKAAVALLVLLVVSGVGYVGFGYWKAATEQKAADAIYQPEAGLRKAETDWRELQQKNQSAAVAKAKILPVEKAADYNQVYAMHVEAMKGQIRAHAETKAALIAALNLAHFLTEQKQYTQALEVLEIPKFKPKSGELLTGFWLMHRGGNYLENQKFEPAIDSYQSVVSTPALKPFHPEALLKLGVCYETKGEADKARTTYERVSREFPETEASTFAKQYLRLLELKPAKQG